MEESTRREAIKLSTAAGAAAFGAAFLAQSQAFGQDRRQSKQFDTSDLTFESVNAQIERLDLPADVELFDLKVAGIADLPEQFRVEVCRYYRSVRSIFLALSIFPLIPANWRTAIRAFMVVMDQICPE